MQRNSHELGTGKKSCKKYYWCGSLALATVVATAAVAAVVAVINYSFENL